MHVTPTTHTAIHFWYHSTIFFINSEKKLMMPMSEIIAGFGNQILWYTQVFMPSGLVQIYSRWPQFLQPVPMWFAEQPWSRYLPSGLCVFFCVQCWRVTRSTFVRYTCCPQPHPRSCTLFIDSWCMSHIVPTSGDGFLLDWPSAYRGRTMVCCA